MTNSYVLVGRLTTIGEMKKGVNGKYCRIVVAVNRNYKNSEGVYETDFIKVTLRKDLATKVYEYCEKGDLIGIRGVMECLSNHKLKLVADKVSFLATRQRIDSVEKQHENDDIPLF